jgi:3-oxoacyl-[acyl-carrier-protein] synthase II
MSKKRIVVTGMGVVSCLGTEVDEFYNALLAGKSGIKKLEGEPWSHYSTRIAAPIENLDCEGYLDKKQARRVDPFIKYSNIASKKALEHAQLPEEERKKLDLTRCGVLVGSGMGGMEVYTENVKKLVLNPENPKINPFFIPYIITNMGGGLVAIDLGFMGPNYSISTACATANFCIYAAANHIRNGEADLMLAGGVEAAIIPMGMNGFIACKALSRRNDEPTRASRPWDKQRDGFVMGEGAGVLVLESLEHAQKRGAPILAEYLGGAISCDAHHMTNPRDDGMGVRLCMENALKDADIEQKERVNYINAHATSTPAGDMVEVKAVKKALPHMHKVKMNATKSMTGHCLGAAAGIEAIATIQAIRTGKLHPTINLEEPEDDLGFDPVANKAQDFEVDVAVSNSFGFGGHNGAVVFSKFKK